MPLLDLFWTMLIFFLFFIWIWLLISIFADIFRSDDMGGWAKALWVVFVVIVPFLGVLIYVIVRGQSMQQRSIAMATKQQQAEQAYIRQTAGAGTGSAADQLAKLAELHDSGALTDAEFESQKAKVLA